MLPRKRFTIAEMAAILMPATLTAENICDKALMMMMMMMMTMMMMHFKMYDSFRHAADAKHAIAVHSCIKIYPYVHTLCKYL